MNSVITWQGLFVSSERCLQARRTASTRIEAWHKR